MRFLMIGGFLGAGKTTAIARLARRYSDLGRRVGIVTNDQAFGLVDTMSLQGQGFRVGEVPGACFCCKFDDLLSTIDALEKDNQPDFIITEPVGSCTDLAATVIEPLRRFHAGRFEIAPLAVLLKPEHGLRILRNEPQAGFSPKAAYIFLKQLEEADVMVINKIDKLREPERDELAELVRDRFPATKLLMVSAKTGAGFEELAAELDVTTSARPAFMDVDYDVYAEGEAELGWLNATCTLSEAKQSFSLDKLAVGILESIKTALRAIDAEPAHLKVLCQFEQHAAIANLVGSDVDVDLSAASNGQATAAEITVNARATASPESLEQIVRTTISQIASTHQCTCEIDRVQSFRPGRPVPTHRLIE